MSFLLSSTELSLSDKFFLLRDTREQEGKGWFLDAHKVMLQAADYGLGVERDGEIIPLPELVLVERKGRPSELANNIGKHRARFLRELEKMRIAKYRFLLMEFSLEEFLDPPFSRLNRRFLLCSLLDMCLEYGIVPLFCGNAPLGEETCQTLFQRVIKKEKGSGELGGTSEPINQKRSTTNQKEVNHER